MLRNAIVVSIACLYASAALAAPTAAAPPPPTQRVAPPAPAAVVVPPPTVNSSGNKLIVRAPVELSVANAILADGDSVDLKATLKDKTSGAPLPDQTINFKIDGKVCAVMKTDASGVALVKGHKAPSDMPLGSHVLEAVFAGNEKNGPSTVNANFTLLASATDLTLKEVDTFTVGAVHPGEGVRLVGKLLRGSDKLPLAGKKIRVLIGEVEPALISPATVDAAGSFDFYAAWPTGKLGDIPVKVVFDATEKLLSAASKPIVVKSVVGAKQGLMILNVSPTLVVVGDKFTLTASLREDLGSGIPGLPAVGESVRFFASNGNDNDMRLLGTATSNQNGNAVLQTKLNYGDPTKPQYLIAEHEKNGVNYNINGVFAQSKLTLIPAPLKLTVSGPANGAQGQLVSLKLKLTRTNDGATIPGSVIIPQYNAQQLPANSPSLSINLGGIGGLGGSGSGTPADNIPDNLTKGVDLNANGEATVSFKLPAKAGAVTIASVAPATPSSEQATGNTLTINVK